MISLATRLEGNRVRWLGGSTRRRTRSSEADTSTGDADSDITLHRVRGRDATISGILANRDEWNAVSAKSLQQEGSGGMGLAQRRLGARSRELGACDGLKVPHVRQQQRKPWPFA